LATALCGPRDPGQRRLSGRHLDPEHTPEEYEGLGTLHPMGRVGDVSDIVGAVMYLESAPFVTGEILHVDGGQRAGH
jgi:NAD(P)-dependent dehydrogenase (short-subunit alcohol dehydrogenase family)